MRRLYDDNLYQFDTPQGSYWEATAGNQQVPASPLSSDASCDVAIIGGGYTGLSAALHLARDHSMDVRVLEAGHFGWGASGRNGGFCCRGGAGVDLAHLMKKHGKGPVRELSDAQTEAVELVRDLLKQEGIDAQTQGDCEVLVAHSPREFAALKKEHEFDTEVLGLDVELVGREAVREHYFDSMEQHGGIVVRPNFGLHPLRYCRGLAAAAARRGAVLHDQSEVLEWSKGDDGFHRLRTASATLRARRVIHATNGFIDEDLRPELRARTLPIISAIIATRPLTDDERAAHGWITEQPAANTRRILNYFRMLPDGRFMFGGRGHGKGRAGDEQVTYSDLRKRLASIWPHWSGIEIEYGWQGLICFTGSLRPAIGTLEDDPTVHYAFGYHGNGVSTATWAGRKLAQWVATGQRPAVPAIIDGMGKKFPFAGLRLKYLQLGIAYSSWLDNRR